MAIESVDANTGHMNVTLSCLGLALFVRVGLFSLSEGLVPGLISSCLGGGVLLNSLRSSTVQIEAIIDMGGQSAAIWVSWATAEILVMTFEGTGRNLEPGPEQGCNEGWRFRWILNPVRV